MNRFKMTVDELMPRKNDNDGLYPPKKPEKPEPGKKVPLNDEKKR